jgi:hypothetical protein
VEKDPFCQEVLKCRMDDKLLERAPIYSDVKEFKVTSNMIEKTKGVGGGFPCQAFGLVSTTKCKLLLCSLAGNKWMVMVLFVSCLALAQLGDNVNIHVNTEPFQIATCAA